MGAMESLASTMVLFIQIGVGGFVAWGAWRVARDSRTGDGFERAASLVLLALLCTTLAGAA